MKVLIIFILSLILAFSHCVSIDGKWENELGSVAFFNVEDSVIKGNFYSSVGDTSGIYVLDGRITSTKPPVISWTVSWNTSITTWNGIFYSEQNVIEATWLLTRSSVSSWNSTEVGNDIFKQT